MLYSKQPVGDYEPCISLESIWPYWIPQTNPYTMNTPPPNKKNRMLFPCTKPSLLLWRGVWGASAAWFRYELRNIAGFFDQAPLHRLQKLLTFLQCGRCGVGAIFKTKGTNHAMYLWVEICALNLYTVTTYCSQNPLLPWIYLSLQSFSHVILYLHFAQHKPHISWQPSHLT